jgi:hypothetical protein
MKTKYIWMVVIGLLGAVVVTAAAADKKHLGGPKGGRLLEKTEPRAEFFLEQDRTATITFYDAALKPIPAGEQTVTIAADTRDGKQTIEFEKKGEVLVSKAKLPEGDGYGIVVQLRARPDAKPQNLRFKLETHVCGGCHRAEYACTCDE